MKRLIRWAFRFILLLVILVAIVLLLKDSIIRAVAEKRVRVETGMDTTIESFHVGVTKPVIQIKNLRIYNPRGFDNARFMEISEIYIEYDPAALASGKLHCTQVRYNLADVSVVENQDGKTNVKWFEELQQRRASAAGGESSKLPVEFAGIDNLDLTLGRIRYSSMKHPERAREIILNEHMQFKDVKSVADCRSVIGLTVANIFLKRGMDFLDFGFSPAIEQVKDAGDATGTSVQKVPDSLPAPTIKK